jgi:NAD(P)H dehydrogenase (quinone)
MIAVTGATGQLGRLVIEALLKTEAPASIVALVRNTAKAADLAAKGVVVREADYDKPATLVAALAGIDKLLLISASEIGKRAPQHKAVIAAAKEAGVKLVAYTSLLHADSSPLALREDHVATETGLKASGIPTVILRNGWYTENYTMGLKGAVAHGVIIGSAGQGKIASAPRADYAAAAAAVLTAKEPQAGKVYELAGDTAYTLAELAAETAAQSGKPVVYNNLPEADYKAALVGFGLPEGFAALLANSDVGASKGGLYDDGHTLATLIGHPTGSLKDAVAAALKG